MSIAGYCGGKRLVYYREGNHSRGEAFLCLYLAVHKRSLANKLVARLWDWEMRLKTSIFLALLIYSNQKAKYCRTFVGNKRHILQMLVMANESIDSSTKLGDPSNSTLVLDTTNPAPPKKKGSPSSLGAPEKEEAKENRLLNETRATLTPPLGQFFINMILQIAAFAAAIAFGVFAVKSIDIARTANKYSASANSYAAQALEEAHVANQIAMLAVCSQSGDLQVCVLLSCIVSYQLIYNDPFLMESIE